MVTHSNTNSMEQQQQHESQRSNTSSINTSSNDVIFVKLEKQDKGLGFSVLDSKVSHVIFKKNLGKNVFDKLLKWS